MARLRSSAPDLWAFGGKGSGDIVRSLYCITHPDVVIDPTVPAHQWPLSARGWRRMPCLRRQDGLVHIAALSGSTKQTAIDGATILSEARGSPWPQVAARWENDRATTGDLPQAEVEAPGNACVARPHERIRGWERAIDAQGRIVEALAPLAATAPGPGPMAVVSHGGVGMLLLCHLTGPPLAHREEPPGTAGGHSCWCARPASRRIHGWRPMDGEA
jgi:broad specificity phosphatase PhoE